jgi:hypothetical protein
MQQWLQYAWTVNPFRAQGVRKVMANYGENRQDFALNREMIELLSMTSLKGICLRRDVRAPYRSIWLALEQPSPVLLLTQSGWKRPIGVLVSFEPCASDIDVSFYAEDHPLRRSVETMVSMTGLAVYDSGHCSGLAQIFSLDEDVEDQLGIFRRVLDDNADDDIQSALSRVGLDPDGEYDEHMERAALMNEHTSCSCCPSEGRYLPPKMKDPSASAQYFITRLMLNFFMYLSSSGSIVERKEYERADAKNARKFLTKNQRKLNNEQKANLERLIQRSRGYYTFVGPTITQDEKPSGALTSSTRRRHWVRGHWRRQRVGAGLTQSRWVWVKPHKRGQELADMVNRKAYIVT